MKFNHAIFDETVHDLKEEQEDIHCVGKVRNIIHDLSFFLGNNFK